MRFISESAFAALLFVWRSMKIILPPKMTRRFDVNFAQRQFDQAKRLLSACPTKPKPWVYSR